MGVPFFRFYPADFEADTSHLTLLEDGAYNRLLRLMWMTPGCSLPDDEQWIFRRMRARTDDEKEAIRTVLDEFFERRKQRVFNNRLAQEYDHASHRREIASHNGAKGGRPAKALKNNNVEEPSGLANQKLKKANQNQNQNQIDIVRFDEFWAVYPHRGGVKRNRKGARLKYEAAVKRGIPEQTIIDGAKKAHQDRRVIDGFARDPTTWINQEGWDDEIDLSRSEQNSDSLDRWKKIANG